MSKNGLQYLYGLHGSFVKCCYKRQAQYPARTFQLLARPSASIGNVEVCHAQRSYVHSTRSVQEQQLTSTPSDYDMPIVQHPKAEHDEENPATESDIDGNSEAQTPNIDPTPQHSFREYMRKVTHPVAIVTSADSRMRADNSHERWRGATVSSFNSVTLDPEPYVSFNIKKVSSTYRAIKTSRHFAVHLLSNTTPAAELATRFSKGNDAEPFYNFRAKEDEQAKPRLHVSVKTQPLWNTRSNFEYITLPPQFKWRSAVGTDVIEFQMLCEYQKDKTIDVGDHVIVVGKAMKTLGIARDRKNEDGSERLFNSLTYTHGRYSTALFKNKLMETPLQEIKEDKPVTIKKFAGHMIRKYKT